MCLCIVIQLHYSVKTDLQVICRFEKDKLDLHFQKEISVLQEKKKKVRSFDGEPEPLCLRHHIHAHSQLILCTLHTVSASGGHTLHNLSTGGIADNSNWSINCFTTKYARSDTGNNIRSQVRQEFLRETGFIPVKNGSLQEACNPSCLCFLCPVFLALIGCRSSQM